MNNKHFIYYTNMIRYLHIPNQNTHAYTTQQFFFYLILRIDGQLTI